MKTSHGSRSAEAFTLIELLTVVAIILLLLSLMVPSLGGVKEKGRAVICKNNLRQLHTAITLGRRDTPGLKLCNSTWMSLAEGKLKGAGGVFICPDDDQGPYDGAIGTFRVRATYGWVHFIPIVEGPMAKKLADLPGGGYRLGIEDSNGSYDLDYNDIVIDVTPQGLGSMQMNVVSHSAGATFDLVDSTDNVVLSNLKGQVGKPFSVQGGACSYGFNDVIGSTVESKRGKRPMLCDYERTEVKVSGITGIDNWQDFYLPKQDRYEFGRHDGKMNVLFTDGSVTPYVVKDINPSVGNNRRTFWGVQ